MMIDNELFELCKEVYKKTGWSDKHIKERYYLIDGEMQLLNSIGIHDEQPTFHTLVQLSPLYTSDYLLEKLPKGLTTIYGSAYPLSPQVMASGDQYYAMYKHDMTGPDSAETIFEVEANTPLKALLKLVIALADAGELK
jgi:hypothetical protein